MSTGQTALDWPSVPRRHARVRRPSHRQRRAALGLHRRVCSRRDSADGARQACTACVSVISRRAFSFSPHLRCSSAFPPSASRASAAACSSSRRSPRGGSRPGCPTTGRALGRRRWCVPHRRNEMTDRCLTAIVTPAGECTVDGVSQPDGGFCGRPDVARGGAAALESGTRRREHLHAVQERPVWRRCGAGAGRGWGVDCAAGERGGALLRGVLAQSP